MTLDDYLRKHGLSSAQFAKATGVLTKQTVHNYRHGLRFPSPETLRLIDEKTGGDVTPRDFVEQHAGVSRLPPAPANDSPKPKAKRATRSTGAAATPTSSAKAA